MTQKKTENIVKETAGLWKDFNQTGAEYQNEIRKQLAHRRKAFDRHKSSIFHKFTRPKEKSSIN